MKHKVELSARERVNAWLEICDFTFRLMSASLDKRRLEKRLRRMREDNVAAHKRFLSRLGMISR